MFTSLLLTASLTGGQPAANYYPPGSLPGVTAVGQPAQLPPGPLPAVPDTAKKDVEPKKEAEPAKEEEKKEEEPKPPTKYFFEKSIAETRRFARLKTSACSVSFGPNL